MCELLAGMPPAAEGFSARWQLRIPGQSPLNSAASEAPACFPAPSMRPGWRPAPASVVPLPAGSLPTCTCPEGGGPLPEKSHFN